MTIAHIAGAPFEEWFTPLAVSGSTFTVALRAALRRAPAVNPSGDRTSKHSPRHADGNA